MKDKTTSGHHYRALVRIDDLGNDRIKATFIVRGKSNRQMSKKMAHIKVDGRCMAINKDSVFQMTMKKPEKASQLVLNFPYLEETLSKVCKLMHTQIDWEATQGSYRGALIALTPKPEVKPVKMDSFAAVAV